MSTYLSEVEGCREGVLLLPIEVAEFHPERDVDEGVDGEVEK